MILSVERFKKKNDQARILYLAKLSFKGKAFTQANQGKKKKEKLRKK